MPLTLAIGQATDPGRVRQSNEDSLCVLQPPSIVSDIDALIAVADGMGGHNAGEIASGFVTEKLGELFRSPDYRKWVDYSPEREDYYALVLKEVLEKLNDQLHQMASRREEWRGMGTTITVGLFASGNVYLGHVGDSRAYLLSQSAFRQLTKDHAWVMEQVEQGLLSPEQAAAHPRKNEITRALGANSLVRVDRYIQDLNLGDTLLLCTDGLTNLVSDAEMQKHLRSIADPQQCCQTLIQLANQRGGGDNITVIVARVVSNTDKSGIVIAPPYDQTAVAAKFDTEPIIARPRRPWQRNKHAKPPILPVPGSPQSEMVDAVPKSAPPGQSSVAAQDATSSSVPGTVAPSESFQTNHSTQTARPAREKTLAQFAIGFGMMGYVILAAIANAVIAWYFKSNNVEDRIFEVIIGAATLIWVVLGLLGALFGFSYLFNRQAFNRSISGRR